MAPARILLVEDSPTQIEVIRAYLGGGTHVLQVAESAAEALAQAEAWQPDAVLLDIGLPDGSGFEVMRDLRARGLDPAIVVITANGSVGTAVEAMQHGARDFLVKPFAKARLLVTLENTLKARADAAALRESQARVSALEEQAEALERSTGEVRRSRFQRMVGRAPAMQAVYRAIEAVAPSRAAVFITGESGTGKELAAEAVHRVSPRRAGPFVPLNCAAIPRDLLESEIFGHVKGAFTGATENRPGAARAAHGGTLFLDEVCEMPPEMQVKLLRFVQTGSVIPVGASAAEKVDVRFVCATNRDPLAEVDAGRFREDLYYRLYVVPLELPPLRARGDDVLLLARQFLGQFARDESRRFRDLAPDAAAVLRRYPWPGNVRQLQNVIRNVVVLHDGELVTPAMLPAMLLHELDHDPRSLDRGSWSRPSIGRVIHVVGDSTSSDHAPAPAAASPSEPAPTVTPLPDAAGPAPLEAPLAAPDIMPLAEMERRLIQAALAHTGHDVVRAAVLLQVSPSTVYRKLQAWRCASRA